MSDSWSPVVTRLQALPPCESWNHERCCQQEDEEFNDSIQCSWKYVIVCFVMPALDGCINGFFWSGYSLYFQERGWVFWCTLLLLLRSCNVNWIASMSRRPQHGHCPRPPMSLTVGKRGWWRVAVWGEAWRPTDDTGIGVHLPVEQCWEEGEILYINIWLRVKSL